MKDEYRLCQWRIRLDRETTPLRFPLANFSKMGGGEDVIGAFYQLIKNIAGQGPAHSGMRIYYHPTCASSYRVLGELSRRSLLDRVELVRVSHVAPTRALAEEIWSVPWLTDDGGPLATDPIEPEEAASIVELGRARLPEEPVRAFMSAVLASLYASALTYVHGSLRAVASRRFAEAALRSRLGGPDAGELIGTILREDPALVEDYRGKLMRTLSYGVVRTLWWAGGGVRPEEPPSEREVGLWLLSSASLGRVGLPDAPHTVASRARELAEAVRSDFERLARKVDEEQSAIMHDSEYWALVRRTRAEV